MTTNRQRIEALLRAVEKALVPFVDGHMHKAHGPHWRQYAKVPKSLSPMARLDAYAALFVVERNWIDVFQNILPPAARDAATAALAGRNAFAHGTAELADDLSLRALSGGRELLDIIGAKTEAKAVGDHFEQLQQRMVLDRLRAEGKLPKEGEGKAPKPERAGADKPKQPTLTLTGGRDPEPAPAQGDLLGGGDVEGLKPWRIVMPPREEVLSGSLNKDAFAANLAVVDREYQAGAGADDALNFLEATHLTRGLRMVLERAAKRFTGGDAPSTIGLQTSFGGGKTHTLLSLLHLARLGDLTTSSVLDPVRSAVATDRLPNVRTAVFSGVDKGPNEPLDFADGQPIRTLWGYLAWRLAGREGLQLVARSEQEGTNPGAEAMQKVLELTGDPCLVLLDELVVFVRQLRGQAFEAHLSFLQSLTEAASQVPTALVVGSLPESDIEAGQEQGREALRRLEKLFGRVQSAWEPAADVETYAVVRRRLFQAEDEAGRKEREKTLRRFHKLYKDNKADFPSHVSQADYLDRMAAAYPVHPMLFDVLAREWGQLDKFQKTRGVLALIARIAYHLYMLQREEPLILPSSIRMDDPPTKGALIEPLPGLMWSAIISGEVDGENSLAWNLEREKKRYGNKEAARRAARSVFLCTAPGDAPKAAITAAEVRLACVSPGEQLAQFPEALRELSDRSAHLYYENGKYRYGSRPTLNRTAQLREQDIEQHEIDAEITRLLRQDNGPKGTGWARVHVAPDQALQAVDEPSVALVILGPEHPWEDTGTSRAEQEARDGVERRAGGQRKYRNAVLFLAADVRGLEDARRLARRSLAWQSVMNDASLDLTDSQKHEAKAKADEAVAAARRGLKKAWTHLLVPTQSPDKPAGFTFDHESRKHPGNEMSAAEHAWKVAREQGFVIENLGPRTLRDKIVDFWRPEEPALSVDEVRDWHFQYLHMERPRDGEVVAEAIAAAVMAPETPFAAARRSGDGFTDVRSGERVAVRYGENIVLLKMDAVPEANGQGPREAGADGPGPGQGERFPVQADPKATGPTGVDEDPPAPRRFNGVVELDPTRGPILVGQIFENVIHELDRSAATRWRITLEIHGESEEGFPDDVVKDVDANASSLGLKQRSFDR